MFPYVFIVGGALLLLGSPLMYYKLRTDPTSVLRSQYQEMGPGCAYVVGGAIILVSIGVGMFMIVQGLFMLGVGR